MKLMPEDFKLPISIIIAAIIIAVTMYLISTRDYRIAVKYCEQRMMSDGTVKKEDLEQDVFKKLVIPGCVLDKLSGIE